MKAYFCLEMTALSTASIIYYHNTTENAQANDERYKLFPTSNTGVSLADVCDDTANTTAWEILVKQGSEATAAVDCPSDLEGLYGYTITSGGVTSCALNESSLDVCTDASQLSSNMTLCSTESIAYTADGEAVCIYTTTETYDYALVLNMDASTDESTTYRVSCLVISSDANNTFVSQSPQVCVYGQTPTSVSGGATVILEKTDQCVSTTTQTTGTPSTTTDQDDGAVAIATSLTTLLAAIFCAIFL